MTEDALTQENTVKYFHVGIIVLQMRILVLFMLLSVNVWRTGRRIRGYVLEFS